MIASQNHSIKMTVEVGSKISDIESLVPEKIPDSYHLVHILFFFFGLVRMLPWTFFITASKYWEYKLRTVSLNDNDDGFIPPEDRNEMQKHATSSLTIALQLSNVSFLFLGMIFGHKIPVKVRLIGSLTIVLLLFIIVTSLVNIDTDSWQMTFFIISLVLVGLVNAISSILDITTCSIISNFPPNYLGVNLNGQGFSGIFTALLQIFSLSSGLNVLKSATMYFSLGIGMIAFTLFLMLSMKYNQFYQYNMANCKDENTCRKTNIQWSEAKVISKKIWPSIVIFICYIVSYNAVQSMTPLVVSEYEKKGDQWSEIYFTPVTNYLLGSVSDVCGRMLAIRFNNWNMICLIIVNILRVIIFVPLLMLCNAYPRSHLPVLFTHDYQYILLLIAFRLSNGYMICLCSLYVPKLVNPEERKSALQIFAVLNGFLIGAFSFLNSVSVEIL